MTGLPFVWALWAGRPGVLSAGAVADLQAARDRGVAERDAVATEYAEGDPGRAEIGRRYLRDNMHYALDDETAAGLAEYLRLAAGLGLAPAAASLRFY
jgi:predicted solute-binding protein